jgi:hypothetical protein
MLSVDAKKCAEKSVAGPNEKGEFRIKLLGRRRAATLLVNLPALRGLLKKA